MRIVVRERMTMVCSSSTGTVVRVCLGKTRSLERGRRGCELVLWTTTLVERSGTIHRWTWGLHDCGHCTAGQLWMRQWGLWDSIRLTLYTSGHTTRYACIVELRISNGLYDWTRSRCFEKAVKSSAKGTGKRVD